MDTTMYALAAQAIMTLKTFGPAGKWIIRTGAPIYRNSPSAAPLSGNRVLLTGGESNSTITNYVTEYNDTTNTWTARATMLKARSAHASVSLSGDRVLAIGGVDGGTSDETKLVERYDAASNSWAYRADLPAARAHLAAAPLSGDKVLAIGGWGNGQYNYNTYEYDDVSNTWVSKANWTNHGHHAAAPLSGDRVLSMGGTNSGTGASSFVSKYTKATNTWATVASMPTARMKLGSAALTGDRVLAIGGYSPGQSEEYAVVECYDDATNTWAVAAPLLTPRSGMAVATLTNGNVLAISGYYLGDERNDTERYDDPVNILRQQLFAIQALVATS